MPPMSRSPWRLPLALAIPALGLASGAPADAQVVISSQGRGEVIVNSDVLDALGPPPTPQLIDPSLAPPRRALAPPPGKPGETPRSRLFALPPSATASAPPPPPPAPSPAVPRSSLATGAATPPMPSPAPAPAVAPSAPPAPVASAAPRPAPPPSPPEREPPRAAMASPPPPSPAIDAPAPRPAAPPPVAAASPPPPARPAAPPSTTMASVAPPPATTPSGLSSPQVSMVPGVLSRVLFTPGSADLNDSGRRELSQLASKLGKDGESRIQLLAYADGSPENESQARRLSLSRALAVRSYLIEQGIRSTRVNVQALGIRSTGGPADRVDAMAVQP